MTKKRIVRRRPIDLTPHRLQNVVIFDVDDGRFQLLKEDIRRNGINDSIEITKDDLVIDGHQRLRVALDLGLEEVRCWLRDDLSDEVAIDQRFLEANFTRRQMSRLEQARTWRRLLEVYRERNRQEPGSETRQRLGQQIFGNVDQKTRERWDQVLDTPIEVQQALEAKQIKLVDAVRVRNRSREIQDEIAQLIRDGQDPKKVIAKYAPPRKRQKPTLSEGQRAAAAFRRVLTEHLPALQRNEADTKAALTRDHRKLLLQLNKLVVELSRDIKANPGRYPTHQDQVEKMRGVLGR